MPPKASAAAKTVTKKVAEPVKATKATTTTKATTKTTTTTTEKKVKAAPKAPEAAPEGPDKAAIIAFVKKYFKPSPNGNIQTKSVDPVITLYNAAPQNFQFHKDNGTFFELKLIPPQQTTIKEKDEKDALISLLQLHAKWITFTPEYNGSSRIKCLITKNELPPVYSEVKTFFSGATFIRDWKRGPGLVSEEVQQAAKRKLAEGKELEAKRTKTTKAIQDAAAQKLVQLGVNSSDSDSDSSSSDSDSDSDSDNEDDGDETDPEEAEEQERKIEAKMAKKRAAFDLTVDRRTGEKLAQFDTKGNAIQKKRWIVFVGNLDYKTRKKHLYKMFDKCDVIDVRISTDKLTKQPKGCAFVEFGNPADIHHALGYDGRVLKGRKVNVELTAGGGGNTKARRQKIEQKRKSLAQEKLYRFGVDTDSYNKTPK